MTKRILAAVVFVGSLAGGSAFADDAKPAAVPKCRAVDAADATKVVAEAEDMLTTKCTRLLEAKAKAAVCADAANKGKKVDLVTQFDHMIGKAKMKDGKLTVSCGK